MCLGVKISITFFGVVANFADFFRKKTSFGSFWELLMLSWNGRSLIGFAVLINRNEMRVVKRRDIHTFFDGVFILSSTL